jgi:hypothetical protein
MWVGLEQINQNVMLIWRPRSRSISLEAVIKAAEQLS